MKVGCLHQGEAAHQKEQVRCRLIFYSNKDQPIRSKELEALYGLNGQNVRAIIHELRMEGAPIASGPLGYWHARTAGELEPTLKHLRSRAHALFSLTVALDHTRVRIARGDTLYKEAPIANARV